MPFPEGYIVNWKKHTVADGLCSVCSLAIPSSVVQDGFAYEKQGRWLFGGKPKKSEDCEG